MGLTPEFRLLANGGNITETIKACFLSLSFTDEAGLESDTLEIVLDDGDTAAPIQLPPEDAELELFLGYDGAATRMGLFVVDEIELTGWPSNLVIRARAAPFVKSTGGKAHLQSQKTRSWAKGTTLGAMVAKMAGEHGLEPAVSPSLASIALPHTDQADESDMHLLVRLAKKYDGVIKPAGGKLIMAKRGEAKTMGGEQLPAVTLAPGDVSGFSVRFARREVSGSVVAAWHEPKKAKRHTVTVGEGEPVTRLRMQHTSREQALASATAAMAKRKRGEAELSIAMEGRPDVMAEAPLTLEGFRDGVAGDWITKRVVHTLYKDAGYTCSIDAEKPNETDGHKIEEKSE